MEEIIDLIGVSGAPYRFRRLEKGAPPTSGNFVYVRNLSGKRRIVCCGKARNLSLAIDNISWLRIDTSHEEDHLYVRLNVHRRYRDAEHEDLIAGLSSPVAVYEID